MGVDCWLKPSVYSIYACSRTGKILIKLEYATEEMNWTLGLNLFRWLHYDRVFVALERLRLGGKVLHDKRSVQRVCA